jgi:hypothetical protein
MHQVSGGVMGNKRKTPIERIADLFRLLESDHEGEVMGAVAAMKRLCRSEGLAFADIAIAISNHQGEIEEKKYSDSDAEIIFARGVEKGRIEEARKQQAPPEFYDADGYPRWNEIALFCRKSSDRLHNEWERTFINDMAGKTLLREPTKKQAKHLLAIFVKLGGCYDPKATHLRR